MCRAAASEFSPGPDDTRISNESVADLWQPNVTDWPYVLARRTTKSFCQANLGASLANLQPPGHTLSEGSKQTTESPVACMTRIIP
jgi:hypothetical protein